MLCFDTDIYINTTKFIRLTANFACFLILCFVYYVIIS